MDYVGLYGMLSAAFEVFFAPFRSCIGGRYQALVHDLVWGILASGSTVIAEIARACRTDPRRPLIYDEKRLSEGLASSSWNDLPLANALTRHNARCLERRSLVIVDLTDLAKPYGFKMDDVCGVRDGSRHVQCLGYWAVAVFLQRAPHELVPLRLVPFSSRQGTFVSQNDLIFSVMRQVKQCFPGGRTGVTLEDRGFDGDLHFKFLRDESWPFIIRLRGDRHVVGPWGALPAEQVARTYLEGAAWSGNERGCVIQAGLPDVAGIFHLVACERRFDSAPLLLFVFEPGGKPVETALGYAHTYRHRWGAEDWIRLLKQSLGLERFLVRSAPARQHLCLAAALALTFATELNRRGGTIAARLKEAAESFDETVESDLARLLRGVRAVAGTGRRNAA